MKKLSIAIAAMLCLAAGTAHAQSSVTLFGIVDATLSWGRGSVADRFQLTNSGLSSSRLGFRGREDLGGGMFAGFHLEAGMNNDNGTGAPTNVNNQFTGGGPTGGCTVTTTATPAVAGTALASTCAATVAANGSQGLTFNRRSTVSLGGGWGEIRLGRDYVAPFWTFFVSDPFAITGIGIPQAQVGSFGVIFPTVFRVSNSISYFYNNSIPLGNKGFYFQAQGFLGENASNAVNAKDGRGYGLRAGWEDASFNVSAAYARTHYLAGDFSTAVIGGTWSFPLLRATFAYNRDKIAAVAPFEGHGLLLGLIAPIGPNELRASYGNFRYTSPTRQESRKLALGYSYNFSRRTALYGTWAHVRNSGGSALVINGALTAANRSSSGVDLGLRHSF